MAVDLPTLITWLRAVRATGEHPEDKAATGVIWPLFSVRLIQGGRYVLNQAGERVLELADALEQARAERDALHDRIEGALSAALGDPAMSLHDGDGPTAPDLESLIKLAGQIRCERDELRLTLAAERGEPEGAPPGWAFEDGCWIKGDVDVRRERAEDGTYGWVAYRLRFVGNRRRERLSEAPTARATMLAADERLDRSQGEG